MDISNFYNGNSFDIYEYLGAHSTAEGTIFRTYAPNALKVSLVGDFSDWQEIPMNPVNDGRFYEIFVSEAKSGMRYKFRIYDKNGKYLDHCDPCGFGCELRPNTCSVIRNMEYNFSDSEWLKKRTDCHDRPLNIYEIHLGSWKKTENSSCEWYNYAEIADKLISHIKENVYNYIEIMPLSEHPCDESWGYQITGFFSPTSRYGTAVQLMELIDKCHMNGIGVIIDFVPVHFAVNDYALAKYDGTPLFEYSSDDIGYNEWGSRNFNHAKGEVRSFLQSAANYWLDVYHFDGIRVDAVRNLIYWQGDEKRGINTRAIEFLRNMNSELKKRHPTAIIAAEDSTAYPKITESVEKGGLGFDYKWDMGWMHDTLEYFQTSPMYRTKDYHKLTFSMAYFYNERFILPFSHDEVVHGKTAIVQKMNGGYEEKFPQARSLYLYMIAHPGKKLNFMGNEIGQLREWDEKRQQDWDLLEYPVHHSFNGFIKAINRIYLQYDALHRDFERDNFQWADCDSTEDCIYAFFRKSSNSDILAVFNFSDWEKLDYTVKIGEYSNTELLIDSDWEQFGGKSQEIEVNIRDGKLTMDMPSYSGKIFILKKDAM
ncbi:MAG: 1,4-alpha-glucan branching protein GlgB [Ruminococcus sp.]|nr:1,4-alpha-glucan branching protein GlgB [Ruminococcus sp.]